MIAKPGNGSCLRKIPAGDAAEGWMSLVRLVDFVGVCADLGQAIVPEYPAAAVVTTRHSGPGGDT